LVVAVVVIGVVAVAVVGKMQGIESPRVYYIPKYMC
jgi:hypothetical protein